MFLKGRYSAPELLIRLAIFSTMGSWGSGYPIIIKHPAERACRAEWEDAMYNLQYSLDHACSGDTENLYYLSGLSQPNIEYNHSSSVLLVHVGKAAGRFLNTYMFRSMLKPMGVSNFVLGREQVHVHPVPLEAINLHRAIVIAVRDPVSRFVSAYNWGSPEARCARTHLKLNMCNTSHHSSQNHSTVRFYSCFPSIDDWVDAQLFPRSLSQQCTVLADATRPMSLERRLNHPCPGPVPPYVPDSDPTVKTNCSTRLKRVKECFRGDTNANPFDTYLTIGAHAFKGTCYYLGGCVDALSRLSEAPFVTKQETLGDDIKELSAWFESKNMNTNGNVGQLYEQDSIGAPKSLDEAHHPSIYGRKTISTTSRKFLEDMLAGEYMLINRILELSDNKRKKSDAYCTSELRIPGVPKCYDHD